MSNDYLQVDHNLTVTPGQLLQRIESCQADDIVLSIGTSGSQTKQKKALISRNNIINHCLSFAHSIPIVQESVWLNCMPMNHIAGVMIVYRCWFYHATMLSHQHFDVKKIWHDIHSYQVTHISLVPRMLLRLLDYQLTIEDSRKILPDSLSYVIIGGDKLSDSLYQRAVEAGWPIYISYGMTEATSTIAIGRSPDKLELLEGISARTDSQGVLKIKGAMVISDYADAENRHCFSNGWFESTDLVQLKGSTLRILGRNDFMILSGGENIAPEFIESLLAKAPGIDDVAVGKYRQNDTDERGDTIAVLVCGDLSSLKNWTEQQIQSRYQPRIYIQVDQIPRNTLQKIDRKAVQKLIFSSLKSHD